MNTRPSLKIIPDEQQDFLIFTIGKDHFAVPPLIVRDVLNNPSPVPVPLAPDTVTGLISLRGEIATAITLPGHTGVPEQKKSMGVILEHNSSFYCLMVHTVIDIAPLSSAQESGLPRTLSPELHNITAGLTEYQGKTVILIDTDRLFGDIYLRMQKKDTILKDA